MSESVPHSRPGLGPEEAAAAQRVILSGQVAQGPEVAAFEGEVAALAGRRHAVATSSGTAALHLALRALEVGPGDQVLVPSYVCASLAQAAAAVGARALPADIDADTRNLDVAQVQGRLTDPCAAIIAPHMFGRPAPVAALAGLGVPVIEDCAMCLGTESNGRPVGSLGAVSVCSFYATKLLTSAGEGGMVLTDADDVAAAARACREYDNRSTAVVRFNYKMTDVAAAVGRVQLRRLPELVRRRRELAARYDAVLRDTGLRLPAAGEGHVFHRYVAHAPGGAAALERALVQAGIGARRPVHLPLHRDQGLSDELYPHTARAWHGDISLPLYPALTDDEAGAVLDAAIDAARQTCGARVNG